MKIIKRENFRVEVFPSLFLIENDEEKIWNRTKSLLEDIKRHIDYEDVCVTYDIKHYCSFCGREWEIDDDGCPNCCGEAVKEWEQQKNIKGKK